MLNTQLEHIKTEFKPQTWHVELPGALVLSAFHSRGVAEEVRDMLTEERAYICLCDCPNRECLWL